MEIDFITNHHKKTKRNYLERVNKINKAEAAIKAKKWDYDYWDGDRKINYGGYRYIENRWLPMIKELKEYYKLKDNCRILDIGCGKGFFLYDFQKFMPNSDVYGLDISNYAIENSKEEIKAKITLGNATSLPWEDNFFDLVISLQTLHNLHNFDLEKALKEMERVGQKKYLCVESYRNEEEKANLLYWQVTCESFYTPSEWEWWFNHTKYKGDYSFIYFE